MKRRFTLTFLLPALALTLIVVPGGARGFQIPVDPVPAGANGSPGATASWFIETVDAAPGVGLYVSVAIDSLGATYISYHDATNEALKMAKYVGSGGNCGTDSHWSCETVDDSSGLVGLNSSIAIDPATNLPAIAYWDATPPKHLKLATATNSGWDIVTIDSGPGRFASLQVDATGAAHIAYYRYGAQFQELDYARYVGGGAGNCGENDFQCETIVSSDGGVGQYPTLDLAASGQPHIAYYDRTKNALMYAFRDGSSWTKQAVIPCFSCTNASLDVDAAHGDRPHLAHHDEGSGKLVYAVYVGEDGNCGPLDSWQCDEIDSVGIKTHSRDVSLAVDKAGYPVIAYHRYIGDPFVTASLNVARPSAALGRRNGNCGPQNHWQCDRLANTGPGDDYAAIALNPSGLATVGYFNTEHFGSLKVAYQRIQLFVPLVLR